MLHTEKENLIASTVKEVALLRDMEFRFYIDHIGSIQTMATLIAGFSFTALVTTESLKLDINSVLLLHATGASLMEVVNSTSGTSMSTPIFENPGPVAFYSLLMHVGEMAAVIACLGQMMTVITEALIARLLGARLALRGPDGSIIRSTRHLASALASSTRGFFNGLQFFILGCFFHVLRGQHPLIAIFLICILYPYWRHQGTLADELSRKFHLVHGVTTAFTKTKLPSPRRSPRMRTPRATGSSSAAAGALPLTPSAEGASSSFGGMSSSFSQDGKRELRGVFARALDRTSTSSGRLPGRPSPPDERPSMRSNGFSDEAVQAWRERRRLSTGGPTPKRSATTRERSGCLSSSELGLGQAKTAALKLPTPQRFPPPRQGAFDATRRAADLRPASRSCGSSPLRLRACASLPSSERLRHRMKQLTRRRSQGPSSNSTPSSSSSPRDVDARESPQESARDGSDSRRSYAEYKRLWGQVYHWLNPVSHRLSYLFEQVSEDFEGEGANANKAHKTPTAATSYLISQTEAEQIHRIERDFDAINQRNTQALQLDGGIKGALQLLDLWA